MQWIQQEQARVLAQARPVDEQRRLREIARQTLPVRLLDLADAHGLSVARVTVRNQRSRWGSCGRDRHICLNWRLVLMPEWVRDYVMIHELMHLQRMDHSPKYWALVAQAYPDYQRARRWLIANARELTP